MAGCSWSRPRRSRRAPIRWSGRTILTTGSRGSRVAARTAAATALALLAAAPFLAGGGLRQFVLFDDDAYVYGNPWVVAGLSPEGILWALTSVRVSTWHPLTWIVHMGAVSLFGLDPLGHHLLNVLLHAASTGMLFLALSRMTASPGRSALVAALFGVHPLHVESVAWVSELKDVLSGFFFTAALLAYERYVRRRGVGRYALVTALLGLGLLSKAMLVTLPVLLLLLDVWPLGRLRWPASAGSRVAAGPRWSTILLEKVPLLLLSAGASAWTLYSGHVGGAISTLGELPPATRAANAVVAHAAYLGKTIWPSALAVYYPHPGGHPAGRVAAAAALFAALAAFVVALRSRRPYLAAGWLWFLLVLFPVTGVVQEGAYAMADRYTYLPLIGVFIALVWAGGDALARLHRPRLASGAAALIVAALAVRATAQAGLWRDTETLFAHALSVTENNWFVHNNLGVHYEQTGRYEDAARHLGEALRLNPFLTDAYASLGSVLMKTGREREAEEMLRTALRLGSTAATAPYNLGVVLAARGELEEAAARYGEALQRDPGFFQAHANLANVLVALGRPEEALGHYEAVVRLRPDLPEAHFNLGNFQADAGRLEEAIRSYRLAIERRPAFPDARFNLAHALTEIGRLEEALGELRTARTLAPSDPEIPVQAGIVLARLERRPEAEAAFGEALRIRPGHPGAIEGLRLLWSPAPPLRTAP